MVKKKELEKGMHQIFFFFYLQCFVENDHSVSAFPSLYRSNHEFVEHSGKLGQASRGEQATETGSEKPVMLLGSAQYATIPEKLRYRSYVPLREFARFIVQDHLR